MPAIGAVILAAGGSTRFGSPKQLLVHEGEPLVARAVCSARRAGLAPVVVVVGAEAERITSALESVQPVSIVTNRSWQSGLASSLRAGLTWLTVNSACDAAILMAADQPLVDAIALGRLKSFFDEFHRVVASQYDGTIGVPALIAREYFAELMQLDGDAGAGPWLRKRPDVTRVPLTVAALDIDTPSDAKKLIPVKL